MNTPTQSYLKVSYDVRPAKQVERRMLIDAFHRLAAAGFPIMDYQYTGFGSIYFVDFILFHKLLGMNNLLSVEWDQRIEKRVNFNVPFKGIEVKMGPIGDVIPTLKQELRHLLWLDYDDVIRAQQLQDISLAASTLSPGSIILVTVDVEPPHGKRPSQWRKHFESEAGDLIGAMQSNSDFVLSKLPSLNGHIIEQAVKQGLAGRIAVKFQPLFNFLYKDGHLMLTVGGMFVTASESRRIRAASLDEQPYYRQSISQDSYEIRVPRLTRKERLHLDRAMPCSDGWLPGEFELSPEDVNAYREVYRYCPAYAELLL
jgi:hypothetical protein